MRAGMPNIGKRSARYGPRPRQGRMIHRRRTAECLRAVERCERARVARREKDRCTPGSTASRAVRAAPSDRSMRRRSWMASRSFRPSSRTRASTPRSGLRVQSATAHRAAADEHPGPWRFQTPDPHVALPRAGSPAGAACNRVLLPDHSRPLRRRDSERRIPGVREQRDPRSNGRKTASSSRLALRPARSQVERGRRVRSPVARVTRICPGAEAGRRGNLPREDRRNAGSPTDLDVFGHSSLVASPSLRGRPRPEMKHPEPSTEAGRHPAFIASCSQLGGIGRSARNRVPQYRLRDLQTTLQRTQG